jgi:hypothetical protein
VAPKSTKREASWVIGSKARGIGGTVARQPNPSHERLPVPAGEAQTYSSPAPCRGYTPGHFPTGLRPARLLP